MKPLKNNLKILSSYDKDPGKEYWANFPHNPLPEKVYTPINLKNFESLVNTYKGLLSPRESRLAELVLNDLRNGADSLVNTEHLGPLVGSNSKELKNSDLGSKFADQLASMILDGFVAGPFDEKPFENMRINPVFVVSQPGKIRPILNLAYPKGESYNDYINDFRITKFTQSSAKQVADSLFSYGSDAVLSKVDMVSAYKLIPINPTHWFTQGFQFMGKYFVKLCLVFGSSSAPSIYDRMHLVLTAIVRIISGLQKPISGIDSAIRITHRTLHCGGKEFFQE